MFTVLHYILQISVHKNRRINIYKVANILGISSGLVQSTLKHYLNMHSIAAKFVPSLVSEREKENCVNMCQNPQVRLERSPKFLSKITTGDEMWVYGYDLETSNSHSRRAHHLHAQKRLEKFLQILKACSLFF
jgi:hypothetical protein